MAEYVVFTKEQDAIIQAIVDRVRNLPPLSPGNDDRDENYPAPEVYVVRTPDAGIAALGPTGTGSGTDTYPMAGDVAGSATCSVYYIDDTGTLVDAGFTITVYNLSLQRIYGDIFITARRDKFGKWVADPQTIQIVRGIIASSLAPGSSADLYVYEGLFGSETATGLIVPSVKNNTSCTLMSGVVLTAIRTPDNDQWQFLIYKTL